MPGTQLGTSGRAIHFLNWLAVSLAHLNIIKMIHIQQLLLQSKWFVSYTEDNLLVKRPQWAASPAQAHGSPIRQARGRETAGDRWLPVDRGNSSLNLKWQMFLTVSFHISMLSFLSNLVNKNYFIACSPKSSSVHWQSLGTICPLNTPPSKRKIDKICWFSGFPHCSDFFIMPS